MSPHGGAEGSVTIIVNRDRGPMPAVVIDAPAPVFIDRVVAAGHDPAEASAIGRRFCRGEAFIDPEAMKAQRWRIYTTTR
jgi:hypothetical protein